MKNRFSKKGFTLIELLAVLVVMIIIIAIVIPLVSNFKEIAKREAFRATAYSISDAGRLLIANENESQGYQEFYYLDGKEYNADGWKLDYSGKGPKTGVVVINDKNKVAMAIHNGTYCAIKSADTNKVTVTKTSPDDCNAYSVIATCDTWEQIAIKYDVSLADILAANNETDETSSTCDRDIKIPVTSTSSGSSFVAGGDGGSKVYYKTYYTMGYISTSSTLPFSYEYKIKLGVLPLNIADIEVARVTTQSVFESLDDFKRYITKKNMGEVIWQEETSAPLDISQASVFRDHAARNANMTADDVSVMCDTEACYATVSATVDNLINVNPNTIEGVGQVAYTPIKFTVEFNGEGDTCTVRTATDAVPGTLAGTGASADPYLIESIEDLVALSNNVNAGNTYSGKYISLTNSFDFNNNKSYENTGTTIYGDINGNGTIEGLKTELTTGAGFVPIGNGTNKFRGQLLGNSNCVYNLYINRPETSYVGFIGYNYSGTITTLSLKDVNVTGGSYTGAIAGYNNEGNVYDIDVKGDVVGADYIALGVGYLYKYSPAARATSIIVEGNVRGANYVGGIVGFADDNIASTGYVSGLNKGGTITSTGGNVGRTFGGIDSRYIASSLAVNTITVNGVTVTSNSSTGLHGSDITSMAAINDINLAESALDTYIGGDNDGNGFYWDYDETGKIVRRKMSDYPLIFNLSGAGTAANPYLINNYEELRQASQRPYAVFRLTSDIDLSGKKFYMLGSYMNRFTGTINGSLKSVSNISINCPEASYIGFVGYNAGGKITALDLINIDIKAGSFVGGLAGYNQEGNVSESIVKGNVVGVNYVALGVGYLYKYSPPANAQGIMVEGNVTGNNYIAGIVGFADDNIASTGYLSGVNIGGTINSVGTNVGRTFGGIDSRYIANSLAVNTVKVNGSTISSNSTTSIHGANISSVESLNNINLAEAALDTYIGGDNDGNGFYWDYDVNGILVRKSVSTNPLTFSLVGAGTAANPYLISNYEELRQAALKLNVVYRLTSDIDLNGKRFYMLGSYENRFTGTFNGGSKTISNLTINAPDASYIGFVGYNAGGTVTALDLNNVNIHASSFVGALTGYNYEGLVSESKIQGNVTGNNYVALGVGYLYKYSPSARAQSIIVEGNVLGSNYVGGVVGFADDNIASTGYVSGINKGGSIVSIGGNVGRAFGGIDSRYIAAALAVDTVTINGSVVSSTYPTSNHGADIDSIADINNINMAELALDTYIGGDNDNNGFYWDYDEYNNVVRKSINDYPLTFSLNGAGTAANPYLINTYDDLKMASQKLNVVYKVNSNIDLSGKKFYMLGSFFNRFSGTFDGNTQTISNLSLNVPKTSYIGFVGYNGGGTIKGLNLNNLSLNAANYVGGLAGYNHEGTVKESLISGDIIGKNYLGLAAGYMYKYSPAANATNIIVEGNISGNDYVGGIVGFADDNIASTGYISGINTGGSVSSVGTNAGRIAGGIDSRYSVSTSSVDSVSVNGSTTLCKVNEEPVPCTNPASRNGSDITSSDLSYSSTYTDRGFNFTDESLDYIWYIDGGRAKFREGSL